MIIAVPSLEDVVVGTSEEEELVGEELVEETTLEDDEEVKVVEVKSLTVKVEKDVDSELRLEEVLGVKEENELLELEVVINRLDDDVEVEEIEVDVVEGVEVVLELVPSISARITKVAYAFSLLTSMVLAGFIGSSIS